MQCSSRWKSSKQRICVVLKQKSVGPLPYRSSASHYVLQLKGTEDIKIGQRMLFPADVMAYEKTAFVQSDLTTSTGHTK